MKLACPSDVKIDLPLGATSMSIPISTFENLDKTNLRSEPAGVLDGTHKFQSSVYSQAVKLIRDNGYKKVYCYFHVTIVGRFYLYL